MGDGQIDREGGREKQRVTEHACACAGTWKWHYNTIGCARKVPGRSKE